MESVPFSTIRTGEYFTYNGVEYLRIPAHSRSGYGHVNAQAQDHVAFAGDTGHRLFNPDDLVEPADVSSSPRAPPV